MCVNDQNRVQADEQEDVVDVVANVGGRALDGAKVGAAGGTVGVIAGAALGGAVGAAQTVQADRKKASGGNVPATPELTSSSPKAQATAGASVATVEQQLTELLSLIAKLVAQGTSSAVNRKADSASRSNEAVESVDDAEAANKKDRKLERAAAVKAAKSVAAINSAQRQQQQAAKTIAREQKKLAALGVVPARVKGQPSPQPGPSGFPAPAPQIQPDPNEPALGPITTQKTVSPALSPDVTALVDQLATVTPLLAELVAERTNNERLTPLDQPASPGSLDVPVVAPSGESFPISEAEQSFFESQFAEKELDEETLEWLSAYEGENYQAEWIEEEVVGVR